MQEISKLLEDKRVRVRREGPPYSDGGCVVYWMQRSQRSHDNPALNLAINLANELRKPVAVFFGLHPKYPSANLRHYEFLFDGIAETKAGVEERGAAFVFRPFPEHDLIRFCEEVKAVLVVGDENPMREPESWRQSAARKLQVPFFTVDSDVIVPTRLIGKEEYAARTIRPKINRLLPDFPFELENPVCRYRMVAQPASREISREVLEDFPLDRSVTAAPGAKGGTRQALNTLESFLKGRLSGYDHQRNHPELDATSHLSAYLHFGQLGPHTIAKAVQAIDCRGEARAAYLEELIVRRELAINFVTYNRSYDSLEGCPDWARKTLNEASGDQRPFIYSAEALEQGQTHDELWNAGQKEMVLTGRMHGYLRMYWAKKILEWSRTPEEAFNLAVHLNDKYQLDGRDPNGYTGVAWAIAGKHDRPWAPRRKVFGLIRYMALSGCQRKFDVRAYVARIAAIERGMIRPGM